MDACTANCTSQSVGLVNGLFSLFIQTLLTAQCSISPDSMWPKDYGPTAEEYGLGTYDYIIVGAGSAGCVLADRLSENGAQVLIFDAGGNPPAESEIPMYITTLQRTKYDWQYVSNKTKSGDKFCGQYLNGCTIPRGKMLGGCHSHNFMYYLRGNKRDYDNWAKLGNPTWDWETCLRYFKKSEHNYNETLVKYRKGRYHSDRGKLKIDNYGSYEETLMYANLNAGIETGYKNVIDFNSGHGNHVGYGLVQGTVHAGRRQTTAKNFLIPAAKRPNVHVIKFAHATKVIMRNRKAIGVRFLLNEKDEFTAYCRKEVILSAGVIGSPQILMLSGIGPARHLRQLDIPVIKDLPVGRNLHDHPVIPMFLSCPSNVTDVLVETLDEMYRWVVHGDGPWTGIGFTNFAAYVNTMEGPSAEYPNMLIPFLLFKRGTPGLEIFLNSFILNTTIISSLLAQNAVTDIFMILNTYILPKSRGTVELFTKEPLDYPNIDYNLLADKKDIEPQLRGIRYIESLTRTKSYRDLGIKLIRLPLDKCDCEGSYRSDPYYHCYIRQMTQTLNHPVGTCKMGPDTDRDATVDHKLRVKGIRNLRVCDASTIPVIPSANTNAATIMIAERCSDFIKHDRET